jgi:hypothetical protein
VPVVGKTREEMEIEKGFIHNRQITDEERERAETKGQYDISPNPLSAGGPQEVTLTYTAGPEGIKPGGGLKIEIPQVWFKPQLDDPRGAAYVGISGLKEDEYEATLTRDEVWEYYITIVLKDGEVRPDDVVTIRLGDKSRGGPGAMVQRFEQEGDFESSINRLNIFVDTDGNGEFEYVAARKPLSVIGAEPEGFVMTAPAMVEAGKAFRAKVVSVDRYRNVGRPYYSGRILLESTCGEAELPAEIVMTGENKGIYDVSGVVFNAEGTYTIKAVSSDRKIEALSNPIICMKGLPKYKLYWGEIHTHTALSDGRGTPAKAYAYARDVANLDFAAVADHAHFDFTDEDWDETKKAAKDFDDPGRFVTLPGYEWTRLWDHRNVYYLEDDGPLFRDDDPKSDVPLKLWKCLEGREAIVIPHHNLFCHKWQDHNPKFERAVEIYSMWGLSEYRGNPHWTLGTGKEGISVHEMLATGAKLGFVAGQDNHDARPGATATESCSLNLKYRGGIVAVWASELTREAIFEAIRERRTYGTTGERIIVDFKVNGHLMGEEIQVGSPPEIHADVYGTVGIEKIEVIRNGEVVYTHSGGARMESFSYVDEGIAEKSTYYYVRVTQEDGNMAWASPVFVEYNRAN